MLKLRARPQTGLAGLSCSQQTLESLISGGRNYGAERHVCLFKLDIKGEVMLLSIMGPFPTQRWGLLLMTCREITSKNSILLKDTFIPVLWYPCALDHFLRMKSILLGPEITQIYKNNLIGKEKFSAWRAWDNVQFQFLKTLSETTSTPVPFSDLLLKLRVLELYQLVSLIHHRHKPRYQFRFPLSLLLCLSIVCRKGEKIKLEIICIIVKDLGNHRSSANCSRSTICSRSRSEK